MKQDIKKKIIRRLNILAGQIQGLRKMVEDEKYCVDIIHQSFAVKEALSSFENFILGNHLLTCVTKQMKMGRSSESIKEILDIYKLSKRK